jgi:hypothetical protein
MKSLLVRVFTIVAVIGAVGGATVYFALTGGGEIDVNRTIMSTNQEGFAQPILPNTHSNLPNGGLRPQGDTETPQPPAPPPLDVSSSTATSTGGETGGDSEVSEEED